MSAYPKHVRDSLIKWARLHDELEELSRAHNQLVREVDDALPLGEHFRLVRPDVLRALVAAFCADPDPNPARPEQVDELNAVVDADLAICEHVGDATPRVSPRACPYSLELHGAEKQCLCCDACYRDCLGDI